MFDLKNKVVLITGGSIGIGAKVTEYLLQANVKHVANLDIADDKGIALRNELNKIYGDNKVKFIKCDVTVDGELFKAYDTILQEQGCIDIVINNAGIFNDSMDTYKKEIEVNVTALTTSTFKAMTVMGKDKGGKGGVVVNISSIGALFQDPNFPVYVATKSAVLQFSNCIGASEYYARTGVCVIAMCFGVTSTSMISKEKMGMFDKEIDDEFMNSLTAYHFQKVESAAFSLIEAIKQGESGSTWLSIADKPAKDITETVKKAYRILSSHVFESENVNK